jgi:hypothetical protein
MRIGIFASGPMAGYQTSGLGTSFGGCRLPYWQSDCSILLGGTVLLNLRKGEPHFCQDHSRQAFTRKNQVSA